MDDSDAVLIGSAVEGDPEAYSHLVRRHSRRIFAICLGMLGQLPDAEDAAQEVFVRGYQRIADLEDRARFASWIGQIARNVCRDALRRRMRQREVSLASAPDPSTDQLERGTWSLRNALLRLPEEYRLPLLLYYYDGKDTATLAREMGLSQGGACARLYRARLRLRQLLEEEEAKIHG